MIVVVLCRFFSLKILYSVGKLWFFHSRLKRLTAKFWMYSTGTSAFRDHFMCCLIKFKRSYFCVTELTSHNKLKLPHVFILLSYHVHEVSL